MRKFIVLFAVAGSLAFVACNNQTKTEEQIDSANQAAADSLLNEALTDTTVKTEGTVDSLMADTTHTHVH